MRLYLVCALTLLAALGSVHAAEDWIEREKIRAGWIYHSDGMDRLAFFKQYGMNTLITHAGTSAEEMGRFEEWSLEAKRAGMRLFGVVGASCDGQQAGMRRCVFANGYESVLPCPLEDRYWEEVLTKTAVDLAREGLKPTQEVSGALIDWEMYANSNKGGQIYYTDGCYCDHCFGGFLRSRGREDLTAQVPFKERAGWLRAQTLEAEYQPYLQRLVRAQADRMRQGVAAVNPGFFLGFYPVPHNWHLVGVAQGLGTPEHPMVLWATSTYGGGGARAIADTWQADFLKQEIHCYYAGGMLLRMYSAANLARHMFDIARKTDGYWLFTVHTLCLREEQQSGDYYLCAGTPDDYLGAIRLANQELDRLCADREYLSGLEMLREPVRYRHPGFDVGRFQRPAALPVAQGPRNTEVAVPPLGLIATSYLLMDLQAGEAPVLSFDVTRNRAGDVWGVSYAVLDPQQATVQTGRMTPGEPFRMSFQAKQSGPHTVVLTAGYYGRCQVTSTTVPYLHWTWTSYPGFEVAGPGGTVYFLVPAGVKEFTVSGQCLFGTTQVQMTVLAPDGTVAQEQPTDPYVRSAKLTVPTNGADGQVWALKLSALAGKSYRSLQIGFDKALPPAVAVKREFLQP